MTPLLTLLAPGEPMAERGRNVVLIDDQWYAEDLFAKASAPPEAGTGVEAVERDGRPGFMLSQAQRDSLAAVTSSTARMLFFVSTDTDVKTLMPVAQNCSAARFLVHSTTDKSAIDALNAAGVSFDIYRDFKQSRAQWELGVLTNDSGFDRRTFIADCRRRGIRTVCLQEAVNVDFDGAQMRLRWADIALLQGPHALQYLERDLCFLTGNPRFDDYAALPAPEKPLVLINCNFMFGLSYLERAREWVEHAIHAAESLDLPYKITVHPRDETNLEGLDHVQPSGPYRVRDQLAQCSVLVSRDSSLLYEALLLDRHAVYYDPFGEKERCLREDDTGLIEKCTAPEDLRACLEQVCNTSPPQRNAERYAHAERFLFTGRDGHCDLRVLRALDTIARQPEIYATTDALEQSVFVVWLNRFLHVTLRPRIRSLPWLRALWRFGKQINMKRAGH